MGDKHGLFRSEFGETVTPVHKRSDRRDYVDFKARTVQGDVTINLAVNDSESSKRLAWGKQFKDTQRIGTFTGSHQINILRGDFVFVLNSNDRVLRTSMPMEQKGQAIVSFNGFPRMGSRTQQDFQKFFRFMGISKVTYRHGELTQPLNGISVQHKGATTVPNNGTDTFNPGDKIAVRVPPMDPLLRSKEMKESGNFKHLPPDRLVARPTLVTYNDINDLPGQAIRHLFRTGRGTMSGLDTMTSIRNLRPHTGTQLNQLTRFAVAYKRAILQTAWNAIAVLDAYGLITLNFPNGNTESAYKSLDGSLLKNSLIRVLNGGRPTVQNVGPRSQVAGEQSRGGQASKEKANQLLWLALKLDLVHDSARIEDSTFKPSQNLIDALVAVTGNTHFKMDTSARKFDARRFLNPLVSTDALGSVKVQYSRHFSPETYGRQLAKSQADSATGYYQSAVEAKNLVDSTIGAEALNYSKPKSALDVNL